MNGITMIENGYLLIKKGKEDYSIEIFFKCSSQVGDEREVWE